MRVKAVAVHGGSVQVRVRRGLHGKLGRLVTQSHSQASQLGKFRGLLVSGHAMDAPEDRDILEVRGCANALSESFNIRRERNIPIP